MVAGDVYRSNACSAIVLMMMVVVAMYKELFSIFESVERPFGS